MAGSEVITVKGTLDDLDALRAELSEREDLLIKDPARTSGGFLRSHEDGQFEILELTIAFVSNLAATAAYAQIATLVDRLRSRGRTSLQIENHGTETQANNHDPE